MTRLAATPDAATHDTLAEVRYYEVKKLIDPAAAERFYTAVLGDEGGRALATGDQPLRQQAVAAWRPKRAP